MKTKYGSIAQYNYEIKEEQENKKVYGSPLKQTDKSDIRNHEPPPSIVNNYRKNERVNENRNSRRDTKMNIMKVVEKVSKFVRKFVEEILDIKTKPSPYHYIPKKVSLSLNNFNKEIGSKCRLWKS